MSRAVYIGGFGNGRDSAERVASALELYYEEIDEFTFSEAMSDPDKVRRAVYGVDTLTHSAGMLSLMNTSPRRIEAFGAPLPTAKLRLIGKTGLKTVRMHVPGIGIQSRQDVLAVVSYDISSSAELAVHPIRNLGHLGGISRFNAVDTAIAAQQSDIPTSLNYTDADEYFQLSDEREAAAWAMGVGVMRIPGIHDELVIRPAATLQLADLESRL